MQVLARAGVLTVTRPPGMAVGTILLIATPGGEELEVEVAEGVSSMISTTSAINEAGMR